MLYEQVDETKVDSTLRLKQAQAMLKLFEQDCGRAAAALEEVKEWAYAQDNGRLQVRLDQFLSRSHRACIT
jgi:hypothetical protein